jgi:hypothetical protein
MRLPDSLKSHVFKSYVSTIRSNVRLAFLPELITNPEQQADFITKEFQKRGVNPFTNPDLVIDYMMTTCPLR